MLFANFNIYVVFVINFGMKKDVLKMKQKRLQDALRDNLRRRKAKITNQDSAGTKIINEDTHDDNMKKSNCSGIKRVCGVILSSYAIDAGVYQKA